jgi:hypothetical protein
MVKKPYLLALGAFLLMPVIVTAGALLFALINPEMAAGHPDYAHNWRLLQLLRESFFFGGLLLSLALWFATCLLVLRSKRRSAWWLLLALLGPLGFAVLASLPDADPAPQDVYERFMGKLNVLARLVYEACVFVAIWFLAFGAMFAYRELIIWREAAETGLSRDQVIAQQSASSGMWAFGEMIEVIYLVMLVYLLRPILANLAGRVLKAINPATSA